MKRALKIAAIALCTIIIVADILFCTLLPALIKPDVYKADLQKLVSEQTKSSLEYKKAKIITTPLFSAGLKIEDVTFTLPDGSLLFSADSIKTRIALPSLLLFTIKISCFEVEKPFFNFEIAKDNSNFKIVNLIENILNEQKQAELDKPKEDTQTEDIAAFDVSKLKIKISNAVFKDYKILLNDLHSNHTLDLKGDKLQLGYNNGKTAKIKTFAQLHSDNNVNINANIDINSFLPKFEPSLDEEDDKAQKVKIPFVNPVEMYRNYDLKANLYTKLKIRQNKKGEIYSYGYFDLENVTMKISHIQLPESYIKAKTIDKNIWIDTNIAAAKNQNLSVNGKVEYGKNPFAKIHIKSDKIYFNDLIILTKAFLDSLHIQNELKQISASGFLDADAYIKTNFKKIRSNGYFKVQNGALKVRNLGNIISSANLNFLLDNNVLNIGNSQLFINNSKITFNGNIDKKSVANITIKSEPIHISKLFYAFAPSDIRNSYKVDSGDIIFDYLLSGELKKATNKLTFKVSDLKFSDKINSLVITNENLTGNLLADKNTLDTNLLNKNLKIYFPKTNSKIYAPTFETTINNEDIEIKENKILFNDNSSINYVGKISGHSKTLTPEFSANGHLNTKDIINFIGKETAPFINYNGNLPINIKINGTSRKQSLTARIFADKDNYFTPINFTDLLGQNTVLQTVIDFKPNRIKIKKTGLFTISTTQDEEGNQKEQLKEIMSVDGTIAGKTINLIKINIPQNIKAQLHLLPKSSFIINQAHSIIFGQTEAPIFLGNFNISDIKIPELLTNIQDLQIKLNGQKAEANINNISLNGSDMNVSFNTNILPESNFKIYDLLVNSKSFDVDKVMIIADKASKILPASSSGNNTSASANQNIPVIINNGIIDIKHLQTGNIKVENICSNLILRKNILHLNYLTAKIFDGAIGGNISMDLISSLLKINISGAGINIEKALLDSAGMKDTLKGKASFKADLELAGASYEEQIKNLKGQVKFKATNGQFGPFGKVENLIIAENIRESEFFKTALGGVINSLTTIDTTHFDELSGVLNFKDGICEIEEITSAGRILALHIFGSFDILQNIADMKVRAKMTSILSDLLGPIALINPIKLVNSAASMNVVTAKAFSLFCETLSDDEISTLPSFSNKYVDDAAMKFQLVVKGDAAKPLTLVKSFKWLATAFEFKKADEFVESIPEIPEGSNATTIEEAIKEQQALEAEKQTMRYKIKHIFVKDKK